MPEAQAAQSSVPMIMGFLTGLAVLGGAAITVLTYFLRRYMNLEKEREKLKEKAVKSDISTATSSIDFKLEGLRGDFKALKVAVEASLKEGRALSAEQGHKFETAVNAMREIIRKAEGRFETFQQELKDQRFMVERIRKQK